MLRIWEVHRILLWDTKYHISTYVIIKFVFILHNVAKSALDVMSIADIKNNIYKYIDM